MNLAKEELGADLNLRVNCNYFNFLIGYQFLGKRVAFEEHRRARREKYLENYDAFHLFQVKPIQKASGLKRRQILWEKQSLAC